MSPRPHALRRPLATALLALGAFTLPALHALPASAAGSSSRAAEVRALRASGKILAMEDILAGSRQLQAGEVVEVELDHDHGRYIYEVKIIDDGDRLHKLYIDAANGELLRRKQK